MVRAHAVWAAEQPRAAVRVWLSILAENPRLRQTIACAPTNHGKNFVHPRSARV